MPGLLQDRRYFFQIMHQKMDIADLTSIGITIYLFKRMYTMRSKDISIRLDLVWGPCLPEMNVRNRVDSGLRWLRDNTGKGM